MESIENKIELRYAVELRATEDDRVINGTAIVFNKESVLIGGSFREIIDPEAVTTELIDGSDILMLWNHEGNSIPLARRKYGKGTLKVDITADGVNFSFKVKKTAIGDEILEAVRSGDVDACSFAFIVASGGDSWEKKIDGSYIRRIKKLETIADFSLVTKPAYLDTSCRSLDEFKMTEVIPEEVVEQVIEEVVVETVVEEEVVVVAEEEVVAEVVEAPVEVVAEEVVVTDYRSNDELNSYYETIDSILNKFLK